MSNSLFRYLLHKDTSFHNHFLQFDTSLAQVVVRSLDNLVTGKQTYPCLVSKDTGILPEQFFIRQMQITHDRNVSLQKGIEFSLESEYLSI